MQYDRISGRLGFRFERFTLGSARFLRANVPSGGRLLDLLRAFGVEPAGCQTMDEAHTAKEVANATAYPADGAATPLVTVGIPCFNAGDTIGRAVASVLRQNMV